MGTDHSKTSESLPKTLKQSQANHLIQQNNCLFSQNKKQLGMMVELEQVMLVYNPSNWKTSTLPVTVIPLVEGELETLKLYISLKQAYLIYKILKQFQKNVKEQKRQLLNTDQTCCICFQRMPSKMLPCLHQFCEQCTKKYILNKQSKKCPMCRTCYQQNEKVLQAKMFTVIGQKQELQEELQYMILNILRENNGLQYERITKLLHKQ